MQIYSKLVEIDTEFINLDLGEDYLAIADVTNSKKEFEDNEVFIKSEEIYTSGLHILEAKIRTSVLLTNNWRTEGSHIRFFFYFNGNTHVRNGAGSRSYDHIKGMLQRNFLEANGNGGSTAFTLHDDVHFITIKMSHPFYTGLLESEPWAVEDEFHNYILKGTAENRQNETYFTNLKILDILQAIFKDNEVPNLRYHFLKIKLKEMLFEIHKLIHYKSSGTEILDRTASRLKDIRSYLILHLENPPTRSELSKKFGINEKKLAHEFKNIFGVTIYHFIVQERMGKAIKLLMDGYNINETSTLLGYRSVSHFIKAFKRYHNSTPKKIQEKIDFLKKTVPDLTIKKLNSAALKR